jgi:hypothetical protein
MMWQMIVTVQLMFPGPILAVQDSAGVVHDVQMVTQTFRLAIQGFTSKAECKASTGLVQNVPMVFTNALGAVTDMTVTATFDSCQEQPGT